MLFVFLLFAFLLSKPATQISLYMKSGTDVFDDNLRLQPSELKKTTGRPSKIVCKYRLLFLLPVFSDWDMMKA